MTQIVNIDGNATYPSSTPYSTRQPHLLLDIEFFAIFTFPDIKIPASIVLNVRSLCSANKATVSRKTRFSLGFSFSCHQI
jgi:hypothetical protein